VNAVPPPTNPTQVAGSNPTGITLGIKTSDSFNKEVSASASVNYATKNPPPAWCSHPAPFANRLSQQNSLYVFNLNANYDDKWKDGPPALSSVTQNYSVLGVNLSDLPGFPLTLLGSEYHSNQQGIVLEQEYGVGTYKRWSASSTTVEGGKTVITRNSQLLIISGGIRVALDRLYKSIDNVNDLGPGFYMQFSSALTKNLTFSGSFKGFMPFAKTETYGRASADISINYKLNAQWLLSEEVTDTYFATVPAGFRDNSLTTSMGVKWTPKGTNTPQ